MSIHLHIERLVVDGMALTPMQARALRASVELQLAALLTATPPQIASGYAVPAVAAAPIPWIAGAAGAATGQSIARSLHFALTPNAQSGRRMR